MLYRRRNTPVKEYILPPLRIAATIIKIKLRPANKLNKNLRSNLHSNIRSNIRSNLRKSFCKSLCNNLDLQTVSLISSNSHPFLHKHLISFRRFSVKDFKISVVPKVATEVATSVSYIGSSRGGYHEESWIRIACGCKWRDR